MCLFSEIVLYISALLGMILPKYILVTIKRVSKSCQRMFLHLEKTIHSKKDNKPLCTFPEELIFSQEKDENNRYCLVLEYSNFIILLYRICPNSLNDRATRHELSLIHI